MARMGAARLPVCAFLFVLIGCDAKPTVVRTEALEAQQTLAGPPPQVTGLTVSQTGQTTATVRWTQVSDGSVGPASYLLRRGSPTISWGSASGTQREVAGTMVGADTSYTWAGLSPGTAYQFQLVAYRGTLGEDPIYGPLSNVATTTTTAPPPVDSSVARVIASPPTLVLSGIGALGTVTPRAETEGGVVLSDVPFVFQSGNPSVATVDTLGQVISVSVGSTFIEVSTPDCTCRDSTTVTVQSPPAPGDMNEPPGFTSIYDEPWENFQAYRYWTSDNTSGTVEANGSLTWTFPPGFPGGYVPESRVIRLSTPPHGPYQYHRDEGVVLSDNWVGHTSGVNKFRFWTKTNEEVNGYLMFDGIGSGPLRPAINTQGFPFPVVVWRWDDPGNQANPTSAETLVTRGEPHTVETLLYKGTPGNSDGWVKVWLDGVLVLHFVDRYFTAPTDTPQFGPIHFAPYWGGAGSSISATQTFSVGHSYASWGTSVP